MGHQSKILKLSVLSALLILSAAMASASNLNVTEGEEIWAHSGHDTEVEGMWSCSDQDSSKHEIIIESPSGNKYTTVDMTDSRYSYDFDYSTIKSDYGTYNVKLDCGKDGNDETDSFDVKRFNLKRKQPSEETTVYQGSEFSYRVAGFVNGNQVQLDQDNTDFNANFLNGGSLNAYQRGINSEGTNVKVEVPGDVNGGEKTLLTSVEFKKDGGVKASAENGPLKLDIKPTWETQVLNTTPDDRELSYQQLSEMRLTVKAQRKGVNYNRLSSEDFSLTIKDMETENNTVVKNFKDSDLLSSAWKGKGKYDMRMSKIPDLPLGRYNFEVGLDKGDTSITNFTISKYILFSGRITDSSGQAVDGSISLDKEGFQRQVKVENGEYSGNVLPGSYNFTLDFPAAKLSLDGVKLKESKNTVQEGKAVGDIRYDEIPLGEVSQTMEGVTVANAVGVWFGYSFDDGKMSLNYDTSKVTPSQLQVYECVGWNLNGVSCYDSSEWKKIDVSRSNIHPTVGKVNFPVSAYNQTGSPMLLNGYMVVRNTPMQLDSVNLASDRVEKGGQLGIDGKLVTPSQDSVSGATVNVQVVDAQGNKAGSSTELVTNTHGAFSGNLDVPEKEGSYSLKIKAEKKPYSTVEQTLDTQFEVYTERGISVEAPDTEEFLVGSRSESEYTIINTGQAPVKDLKLTLRGFDNKHWNFKRETWSEISPGESVKTALVTNLPGDFCADSCQQYRTIEVEATGKSDGKVNDIASLEAQILKEENRTGSASASNTDESSSGSSISMPSAGKFVKKQSNFNLALGIMIVFILVLAAGVKKKKGGGGSGERRNKVGLSSGSSYSGRNGGMRKQKPELGGDKVIDVEPSEGESSDKEDHTDNETAGQTNNEGESQRDENQCDICGESFDTDAALDIHKQTAHN